jgi:hypothetical protein
MHYKAIAAMNLNCTALFPRLGGPPPANAGAIREPAHKGAQRATGRQPPERTAAMVLRLGRPSVNVWRG